MRVVVACASRAAPYAAALLRDLGASVAALAGAGEDAVARHLLRGVERLERAGTRAIAQADAVLGDAAALDSEAACDGARRVVRLSWSRAPHGPGSDVTCQAAAGVCDVIGEVHRAPLWLPYRIGEFFLGVHGAAALVATLLTGAERARVEVALDEVWANAVGSNAMLYATQGISYTRAGRRAPGSGGPYPYSLFPVSDGLVCLIARATRDFTNLVAAMGNPPWSRLPRYQRLRAMGRDYPDEMDALLMPWLAEKSRGEMTALARRFVFPCAAVRSPAEALRDPLLAEQQFWRDDGATRWPGTLVRTQTWRSAPAASNDASGAAPPPNGRDLSGWRVLDLSWVWAGPMIGALLADLGADVIKIESEDRLDNTRLRGRPRKNGVPVEGDPRELDPYFHNLNRGKRSIVLDLKSEAGRREMLALVAQSDVVLESFTPGVMERLGLGYDTLCSVNERIVLFSMRGASLREDAEKAPSYAPITSSLAGLEHEIAYPGEPPVGSMAFGFSDPNAGMHGALLVLAAMLERRRRGTGAWLKLSQFEALSCVLTEMYASAQGVATPAIRNAIAQSENGYLATTEDEGGNVCAALVEPVAAHATERWSQRLLVDVEHPLYGGEQLYRFPWHGLQLDVRRSAPLLDEH